jgi:hypothetical protein
MRSVSERDSRMDPIRVLIEGDHAPFREGLRLFLAQQEDMQGIGEAVGGQQALRPGAGEGPQGLWSYAPTSEHAPGRPGTDGSGARCKARRPAYLGGPRSR